MTKPLEVLYVEDDPPSIQLLTEAFEESPRPANVHAVETGSEALAFLAREGVHADAPRPDLVFLDLDLGASSGFDVLAELRGGPDREEPPVVVFTSSDDSTDVTAAYEGGANAFVRKPDDFEGLITVANGVASFWGAVTTRSEATN